MKRNNTNEQARAFEELSGLKSKNGKLNNTKKLMNILYVENKVKIISDLETYLIENPSCVKKEWTSKKGNLIISIEIKGYKAVFKKEDVKYKSVSSEGIIIHTGGHLVNIDIKRD